MDPFNYIAAGGDRDRGSAFVPPPAYYGSGGSAENGTGPNLVAGRRAGGDKDIGVAGLA